MHRQGANITARKKQGGYHMPIGAHDQTLTACFKQSLIITLTQKFIVKMLDEQLFDKLRHGAPTGPMGHIDTTITDIETHGEASGHLVHAALFSVTFFFFGCLTLSRRNRP